MKSLAYSTSHQKSSAIGCSIVGETDVNSVIWQFATVCCADNYISDNSRISDLKTSDLQPNYQEWWIDQNYNTHLAGDIRIRKPNYQPIFRRGIFVLVLHDEFLTSEIVSFTFTSPLEFDLKPFEVLLVLDNFYETLRDEVRWNVPRVVIIFLSEGSEKCTELSRRIRFKVNHQLTISWSGANQFCWNY